MNDEKTNKILQSIARPPHADGLAVNPTVPRDHIHDILLDNPMLDESRRAIRRFLRAGTKAGHIFGVLFVLFVVYILFESFTMHTDFSTALLYIELIILTLCMPASIYNAISGERERATWDALILTNLTAGQIVYGKLIWRVWIILFVSFLLELTILFSRFGATDSSSSDGAVVVGQLIVTTWGVCLLCFGLWVSSVTRSSVASLAVIATTLIVLLLAIPSLYAMFLGINGGGGQHDLFMRTMLTFNPFTSLGAILSPTNPGSAPDSSPLIFGGDTGIYQLAANFAASALFIRLTNDRIKRLEQPVVGNR